jgi:hypothetical protein
MAKTLYLFIENLFCNCQPPLSLRDTPTLREAPFLSLRGVKRRGSLIQFYPQYFLFLLEQIQNIYSTTLG